MSGGSWVYLSYVLDAKTPVYGNRKGFSSGASGTALEFPNHVGTHLDAPRHFFENGLCLESYPADFWIFENPWLLDCPLEDSGLIEVPAIERAIEQVVGADAGRGVPSCLLLRTGFGRFRGEDRYWERNPGISPEAGEWVRAQLPSVRLLGLDAISVSRWQDRETGRRAHRALLGDGGPGRPLIICEDMALEGLAPGRSLEELVVLPLRFRDSDGAPCTVIGRRRA